MAPETGQFSVVWGMRVSRGGGGGVFRKSHFFNMLWVPPRIQRGDGQRGSNSGNFFSWWEEREPKYHLKWAIIGPAVKSHLNGVSLAGRWWSNTKCSDFFQGFQTSIGNPINRGRGPDPCPPLLIHTCHQCDYNHEMNPDMRFPTMWYVRPAKPQSLY